MFDSERLTQVVRLQQKSYLLLQWAREALQTGALRLSTAQTALSLSDAAQEWIGRVYESIPADARPERDEILPFAHLFASYLQTSFVLVGETALTTSVNGTFYTYLAAGHLKVRMPDKKAAGKARQMKELYLSGVMVEAGLPPYPARVAALLADGQYAEDIAWATYGRELLRRAEFVSQGEGVLVLWREIAWDARGKLKKNFVLSAERILQAEVRLFGTLTNTV